MNTLRLKIFTVLIMVAFTGLLARLFYWQVLKGKDLSVLARDQYRGSETLSAPRGEIFAADKTWLAASTESFLLYAAIPELQDKPKTIADKIAPLLLEDTGNTDRQLLLQEISRIENLLTRKNTVWVPIKHKISPENKKRIEELKLKGLGFDLEEKRTYPEASAAAHILGFVGKNNNGDDQGYFGLEGYYNMTLSGKAGYISRDEDVRGNPILLQENSKELQPVKGVDLITHIDKTIQIDLDKKLKEGIDKYGAASGTAVIMDPKTGAIMAMSAFPAFSPEKYTEYNNSLFTNPVISSTFEPGSVFKIIVMASALDAGVISSDTRCTVCDGPYIIGKYSIRTWNDKYHPDSSMTDVIVNSDNVGMSFVGDRLGKDRMYDYLRRFGIGSLTGIDLQGESTAKLREKDSWGEVDVATASFGQGVAVTPIQMIRAAAVIANLGYIVTPQVVDKIISDSSWEDKVKPVVGERVISEKAAKEITAMMVEAAKHGESKWTNIPGFKVAGKTGTAQIPIQGHYDADKTIASFVGFAPYDDPKFIMLVTLKQPQTSPWASETAAPLWYSIAKDLFNYFNIQPENGD